MRTATLTARLASDGLQQHIHSTPSHIAEACKPNGQGCTTSSSCCSGWCSWAFKCEPK